MYIYDILLNHPETSNRHALRYINFIRSRSTIDLEQYSECHHILPKSLFPEHKNNPDNTITLTAREHYLAHKLLFKALPNSSEMLFAFWSMCNGWKNKEGQNRFVIFTSSKTYSELKSKIACELSKRMSDNNPYNSQHIKDKIIALHGGLGNASEASYAKQKETMLSLYGYDNIFLTPEFIEKNRQATIERNKDPEYRKSQGEKISKALESVDRKGENNSFYGKKHSEETKEKLRMDKLGKIFPQFSCLCCHKVMGSNNFTQHMRTHLN